MTTTADIVQDPESPLRERVADRLAVSADELAFDPIPTGKFNQSFFVRRGDDNWVVRVAPPRDETFIFYEKDMMYQEPAIHERLRAETTVPVPRILHLERDARQPWLLMEAMPGTPVSEVALDATALNATWRQVGESLRQAHDLVWPEPGAYGYLGEHRPLAAAPTWVQAFHGMWNALLDGIDALGRYRTDDIDNRRHALERHLHLFDYEGPARLLHMDVWAQNVLIDDRAQVTALLDWDRALWGDPEIEFAVLDYCGVSGPGFWDGYGACRDMSPAAGIRKAFYYLYEVQKYIIIEAGRLRNNAAADQYWMNSAQLLAQVPAATQHSC